MLNPNDFPAFKSDGDRQSMSEPDPEPYRARQSLPCATTAEPCGAGPGLGDTHECLHNSVQQLLILLLLVITVVVGGDACVPNIVFFADATSPCRQKDPRGIGRAIFNLLATAAAGGDRTLTWVTAG